MVYGICDYYKSFTRYNCSLKIVRKLFYLCSFFVLAGKSVLLQEQVKEVYIMLDVDGVLIDRIPPHEHDTIKELNLKGFPPQKLGFCVNRMSSPKFFRWYSRMMRDSLSRNEQRLVINATEGHKICVQEIVTVRPAIIDFLRKIDQLNNKNIVIKFLVASRNDDERTKNIVENLNIFINGQAFRNKVQFVPRACFRVILDSPKGAKPGKSIIALRDNYKKISSKAYIIAVDDIDPARFVIANPLLEKHVKFTRFTYKALNTDEISKDKIFVENKYNEIVNFLNINP